LLSEQQLKASEGEANITADELVRNDKQNTHRTWILWRVVHREQNCRCKSLRGEDARHL